MSRIFLVFCCTLVCVVFFVLPTPSAKAALLYFDPAEATVSRGDTITLGLRVDTDENECINTVDAVIKYDPSVRAVDVSRGDSILSLWVEDPKIDEELHTITLAGGVPGGYCGRIAGDPRLTNVIVELVFRSPGLSVGMGDTPLASVWVDETSSVLLNDGFGTPSNLRREGAAITLSNTPGTAIEDTWRTRVQEDALPPADFTISLSHDPENIFFSGKYFISFNSQDKQSGIDHYEVMEEPFEDFYLFRWGGVDAPWAVTESPYLLKDQTLNSTIRVKAIDKAGNETIATLIPEEALRTMSRDRIVVAVALGMLGVLILAVVGYLLWRRKEKLVSEYEKSIKP